MHTAEPIFLLVGAGSRSRIFKAAPAASFRQAKNKILVLVSNMTLRADRRVNMVQNRLELIINFLKA